ncbi:MAG: glycoside hydrolase family 2 [Bacteroidetes bacterium]|nr:glycoside hydrolase family 2 [Bacteroidota bacterium]
MKKLILLSIICFIQISFGWSQSIPRLSPLPQNKDLMLDLNGKWQFNTTPNSDFISNQKIVKSWKSIEVPGEWVMQGYEVKPNSWAGYARTFQIPSDWNNKAVKLRCDAVYSECEVFINGEKVGKHLGGFTAFELDITKLIKVGKENYITLKVKSESIADSLSSGSQYAVHPLGGITRKIFLVALPQINGALFHYTTTFDKDYKDAQLNTIVEIANETSSGVQNIKLRYQLYSIPENKLIIRKEEKVNANISAGQTISKEVILNVSHPEKWDPEHPNLYALKLDIIKDNQVIETINRNVGFRQIEIKGNQVFVNNAPIKLRGVCRHEVMPLRGRSLSQGQWEQDVLLFRAANVNYIRTSHYPPAPEFIEACDRLGMFVEVEAPFCWAEGTPVTESRRYEALIQPEVEMVNTSRSNPSVLIWSLGNESGKFKEYFSEVADIVKKTDPSRPRNFSQYGPDGDEGTLEIANHHYPGPTGPDVYAKYPRPITFDEYCHLNAYNRLELYTDPGVRDAWGIGFAHMWERMQNVPGILGGALWAGIDDSFFLPNGKTVGYGTWGPIDGWRRMKPEYWHVKKVYSPVRVKQISSYDTSNKTILFTIENRFLFSNLNESTFTWKCGNEEGGIQPQCETGKTVTIPVQLKTQPLPGEQLYMEVKDHRGVVIDQYQFRILPQVNITKTVNTGFQPTVEEDEHTLAIKTKNFSLLFDKKSGTISTIKTTNGSTEIVMPKLMILPLNGEGNGTQMTGENIHFEGFTACASNQIFMRSDVKVASDQVTLTIFDSYDEAFGSTSYTLDQSENLTIRYTYELKRNMNPRQWGLVFVLPSTFNNLSWERNGLWNYYPEDHIGRLVGTTTASNTTNMTGPAGPDKLPTYAWNQDQNELGTNDFRSTKMNINGATLSDGKNSFVVQSNGYQHIRCWLENHKTNILVAKYSNMGAERFMRPHAQLIDKPLKQGDIISDTISIKFK